VIVQIGRRSDHWSEEAIVSPVITHLCASLCCATEPGKFRTLRSYRALFCPIAPSALLRHEGRLLDGAREAFMKSMGLGGIGDSMLQRQLEVASMALGEDA
jgi:hypothetical protein